MAVESAIYRSQEIGSCRLKNRLVALPVFTGYAYPDGNVSPFLQAHYATLAASGTDLFEPQEDDLLVLNLPRSEDAETPSEPEPADSPSLETIETR